MGRLDWLWISRDPRAFVSTQGIRQEAPDGARDVGQTDSHPPEIGQSLQAPEMISAGGQFFIQRGLGKIEASYDFDDWGGVGGGVSGLGGGGRFVFGFECS